MLFLIAVSPFHAFLITFLKKFSGGGAGGAILTVAAAWREIAVVVIGGVILLEFVLKKIRPKFDALDSAIFVYSAIALIWLIFQRGDFSQWLIGFRFDVFPFLFFLIVRRVEWTKKNMIITAALISAAVVMTFGIFQAVILPQDFLARFGYSTHQGSFRPDIAIAGCQYLEHTSSFCRAISTFGGPTRYGVYLMAIMGLLPPLLMKAARIRKFAVILFSLALLNITLTYSRSAWIGAVGMFLFFGGFWMKEKIADGKIPKKTAFAILIFIPILILSGFLAFKNLNFNALPNLKTILIRETSTGEHAELLKRGAQTLFENPFGIGLGKAGPASLRYQKFLTENWFLQIAVEMGVAGLLAFLAVLTLLSIKLLAQKNWAGRGLFLSLLGISITGLFTHSFEETSAVLLLFGIAGISDNS